MLTLVRLFGIVIVGIGITFLLSPKLYRQYMAFWEQRRRLYLGGILSILIGVVLLLAASGCRLAGVIIVFGIWAIIKGILLFTLGQERMKSMLKWWQGRSLLALRLTALIAIAFGTLLLYSA